MLCPTPTRRALLLLVVAATFLAHRSVAQGGLLAPGTRFETPWIELVGAEPGPTVLVVAGCHGNEPAGPAAAEAIACWRVRAGRLVVVPRLSRPALAVGKRHTPGAAAGQGDLNRNFPRKSGEEPRGALAEAIWSFVQEVRPDWLLDLHEGYDFHCVNDESVGSTVISANQPECLAAASRMLESVNETVTRDDRRFERLRGAVVGSLARSAFDRLGVPSMIVETTTKSQPLSLRARQHRILVHRFLSDLGLVEGSPHELVGERSGRDELRVALYDGGGASGNGPKAIESQLRGAGTVLRRVGPDEVRGGVLAQFDVLIQPGGSGSGQSEALGPEGLLAVRSFVRGGGGYLGICAGSYLAACNYSWSLAVVDAKVVDRKHWRRGRGTVQIELTDRGREILGDRSGELDVLYVNGPILHPGELASVADFEPLAIYRSEVAKNGAPRGVMIGTAAIVAGEYGEGRALCMSPHPEQTEGMEDFVLRSARWVAGLDPAGGGAE